MKYKYREDDRLIYDGPSPEILKLSKDEIDRQINEILKEEGKV